MILVVTSHNAAVKLIKVRKMDDDCDLRIVTQSAVGTVTHHRVSGMEYIEEAFADRCGQDVVLHTVASRPDPSQRQENSQRRAHAEEIFYLQHKEQGR